MLGEKNTTTRSVLGSDRYKFPISAFMTQPGHHRLYTHLLTSTSRVARGVPMSLRLERAAGVTSNRVETEKR